MIIHEGWPWQPHLCPADLHFIELCTPPYPTDRPHSYLHTRNNNVLQVGPGLHHQVGLNLAQYNAQVLSVTNSPEEYESYVIALTDDPLLSRNYVCIFSDIYSLPLSVLGDYNIIYIPHIGESPEDRPYATRDDHALLAELFYRKLEPNGRIVTYNQSSAYDRVLPIIKDIGYHHDYTYKSLDVWF